MRKVLATMGFLSLLGFGSADAARQAETGQDKTEPATRTARLNVSGMHCGACASRVEGEVKKLDGVKSAKVSQPTGIAEITYDPAKTTPAAIAKIITDKSGFKAEVVPPKGEEKK